MPNDGIDICTDGGESRKCLFDLSDLCYLFGDMAEDETRFSGNQLGTKIGLPRIICS